MEKILSQQNKSVTVIQAAGRVARKADGKEKGVLIDFEDSFGMLRGWHRRRQNIFSRKLGFILT